MGKKKWLEAKIEKKNVMKRKVLKEARISLMDKNVWNVLITRKNLKCLKKGIDVLNLLVQEEIGSLSKVNANSALIMR